MLRILHNIVVVTALTLLLASAVLFVAALFSPVCFLLSVTTMVFGLCFALWI